MEEKGEEKAAEQAPLKLQENGKSKPHKTYPSPTFNKDHDHEILERYELHTTWGKLKYLTCLVFSMLVFILVVMMDFVVGAHFAWQGQVFKSVITFFFIYISSLVTTMVSITWYTDYVHGDTTDGEDVTSPRRDFFHAHLITNVNKCVSWTYRLILIIFNMTPLGSYVHALRIVVKSLQTPRTEIPQTEDTHDLKHALVVKIHGDYERVYHCFCQSIPQVVMQVFFLVTDKHIDSAHLTLRIISILISTLHIVVSLYAYHKNISTRTFHKNGPHFDQTTGFLFWMKYLWHLLFIASRMTLIFVLLLFSYAYTHQDENEKDAKGIEEKKDTEATKHPEENHVGAWLFLVPLLFILIQWLLFSCIMKMDVGREFLLHIANSWMYVWVAMSMDKPGRIKRFYILHYILDLIMLLFVAILLIYILFVWQFLKTIFTTAFSNVFILVFFEAIAKTFFLIFIGVFSLLMVSFLLASIFKLIYYCKFNPHIRSEETFDMS